MHNHAVVVEYELTAIENLFEYTAHILPLLSPPFGRFDRASSDFVALFGIWSRPHYFGAFAPFASFSPLIVPTYWNEYGKPLLL